MKNTLIKIGWIAAAAAALIVVAGSILFLVHRKAEEKAAASAPEALPAAVDFASAVREDASSAAVFAVSAEDWISSFTAVYRADHAEDYILPMTSDHWARLPEKSPCFGYEAVRFQFSEDPKVWPMPTIWRRRGVSCAGATR